MHRLHLILVSVLSKSITVQLITTAATACLRDVIPPQQWVNPCMSSGQLLTAGKFSVQILSLVERWNQSLSVPAALVPAPSKAPVLQEPCLVLVSPAFPRSYSLRLFMAEILHGSCLSFSMRTGMFIHLTKTSMNSLPLKGKIQGEKNPGWLWYRIMSIEACIYDRVCSSKSCPRASMLATLWICSLESQQGWFSLPHPKADIFKSHPP